MTGVGALLLAGLVLTVWWGGRSYRPWALPEDVPPIGSVVRRYLRGVAVVLVAGFWTGVLVTGPAMRLCMRLLAATSSDAAQGRRTEAEEVVGAIDLGGTVGLILFGGILPGLLSAALYVVCRRVLPEGRLGGVVFGVLHLVLAATRLDPLRPDNPDFDLLGPGWLSVLSFGAAAVAHGMAVAAIANRYSAALPPASPSRAAWVRALLPVALPALLLIPGFPALVALGTGLVATVVLSRLRPVVRALRSPAAVAAARVALVAVALASLPGTVTDLRDVMDRDERAVAGTSVLRSAD